MSVNSMFWNTCTLCLKISCHNAKFFKPCLQYQVSITCQPGEISSQLQVATLVCQNLTTQKLIYCQSAGFCHPPFDCLAQPQGIRAPSQLHSLIQALVSPNNRSPSVLLSPNSLSWTILWCFINFIGAAVSAAFVVWGKGGYLELWGKFRVLYGKCSFLNEE